MITSASFATLAVPRPGLIVGLSSAARTSALVGAGDQVLCGDFAEIVFLLESA
jgi:hypothetical protein